MIPFHPVSFYTSPTLHHRQKNVHTEDKVSRTCEHLLPDCWGTAFFPIQSVLGGGRTVGMLGRGGAMKMLD